MINKRLLSLVSESIHYVKKTVVWNVLALIINIFIIATVSLLLNNTLEGKLSTTRMAVSALLIGVAIILRMICQNRSVKSSYYASCNVKKTLREKIYQKLLRMGNAYQEKVSSAEVVQMAVEGVDQLEIYFGKYLPQLFYSLIAPILLFIVLAPVNFKAAAVLLICVPLIPISIVAVQKFAKRLLSKYWGVYTGLGNSFLENLQGLTTLKIYQADERKTIEMDKEAENFRKITMKVLTMQLNSISIMDLVAFGGAAVGIVTGILEFQNGNVSFGGLLCIILLSSEFFIPLRLLGSFFHIAMNGMAASDKIFRLLDMEESGGQTALINEKDHAIHFEHVKFSYDTTRTILNDITFDIKENSFVSFVGKSGCGKSTIAGLITGANKNYSGSIKIGNVELNKINEKSLMEHITLVTHNGYLFAGSLEYNLRMGKNDASEKEIWDALERVNIRHFVEEQGGLSMEIKEEGSNLSGGQRQRIVLARALLRNTPIYIFDEATSNIDVESENDIMEVIKNLKSSKTVLLISHRLENVRMSDAIFVLDNQSMIESGTHEELYEKDGMYASLYKQQESLMRYTKEQTQERIKVRNRNTEGKEA